jgi:hypothetical protein
MEKYPNRPDVTEVLALTGIKNVRTETTRISSTPIDESKSLYDLQEVSEHDLP